LAAGTEGKRYALPNARILIHQPMGSFQGQAADVAIQAKEILRMRETLNEILALHTHQDIETIRRDTDRDYYMSGLEAKDYRIVDHVITQREAAPTSKDKEAE
jgi:ATP-dependent Clp protease protease subunit